MKHPQRNPKRGFLLLEMILALAVFSMAATGFVVALHQMSKVASLAQTELQITRILDSALDETLSLPLLEEGETDTQVEGAGIELHTTIKPIEDMENEDGQILQEMFQIQIVARWYAGGVSRSRTVETWRYGRMYQP